MKEEGTSCHLFYACNYSKMVWKGLREDLHMEIHWEVGGIEDSLKLWFAESEYKFVRCIPFLTIWAENEMIFNNRFVLA